MNLLLGEGVYRNMKGFTFANIHSSKYGLYVRSDNRTITPSLRRKSIVIPEKHGTIDFGNNTYESRYITMHLSLVKKTMEDLRQQARDIAEWLTKDGLLIFDDEPDKAYRAKVYHNIDIEEIGAYGKSKVTFTCQPFAYMVVDTGEDLTWDEADFPWITDIPWNMADSYSFTATSNRNFTFDNPGNKEINFKSPQGTKFNIIIKGSFTSLSLTLNSKKLNYNEAVSNGIVTIDNIEMEVNLNGSNKLNKISGDLATFFEVIPGNNTLGISGTGLNVEIILDFSPMWI